MWTVLATSEFSRWFADDATEQTRIAVYASLEQLRSFGPALSRPHAHTLADSAHSNMKELRVTAPGAEIRIAPRSCCARQANQASTNGASTRR